MGSIVLFRNILRQSADVLVKMGFVQTLNVFAFTDHGYMQMHPASITLPLHRDLCKLCANIGQRLESL